MRALVVHEHETRDTTEHEQGDRHSGTTGTRCSDHSVHPVPHGLTHGRETGVGPTGRAEPEGMHRAHESDAPRTAIHARY